MKRKALESLIDKFMTTTLDENTSIVLCLFKSGPATSQSNSTLQSEKYDKKPNSPDPAESRLNANFELKKDVKKLGSLFDNVETSRHLKSEIWSKIGKIPMSRPTGLFGHSFEESNIEEKDDEEHFKENQIDVLKKSLFEKAPKKQNPMVPESGKQSLFDNVETSHLPKSSEGLSKKTSSPPIRRTSLFGDTFEEKDDEEDFNENETKVRKKSLFEKPPKRENPKVFDSRKQSIITGNRSLFGDEASNKDDRSELNLFKPVSHDPFDEAHVKNCLVVLKNVPFSVTETNNSLLESVLKIAIKYECNPTCILSCERDLETNNVKIICDSADAAYLFGKSVNIEARKLADPSKPINRIIFALSPNTRSSDESRCFQKVKENDIEKDENEVEEDLDEEIEEKDEKEEKSSELDEKSLISQNPDATGTDCGKENDKDIKIDNLCSS